MSYKPSFHIYMFLCFLVVAGGRENLVPVPEVEVPIFIFLFTLHTLRPATLCSLVFFKMPNFPISHYLCSQYSLCLKCPSSHVYVLTPSFRHWSYANLYMDFLQVFRLTLFLVLISHNHLYVYCNMFSVYSFFHLFRHSFNKHFWASTTMCQKVLGANKGLFSALKESLVGSTSKWWTIMKWYRGLYIGHRRK